MRRIPLIIALLATGSIAGCGGSSPDTVVKPPAGGGAMIRLPGNRGFFTIKAEGPPGPPSRKKSPDRSIVAAFFQADGVTPMSPAPTDVVLQLESAGKTTPVALAADANDPARFASTPGPYPQSLQGTVRLKIDGQDVEESFSSM